MKKIILTTLIVIYYTVMLSQSKAVNFSGTNSSINLGNTIGNELRTIELWFKPSVNITSSITDPAYSLVMRNDAEFGEFGLYIIGNVWSVNKGKLAFYVRDNGSINQIHSDLDTWSANTWYHVSGTIDPNDGMKLYIDGALQTETKSSFTNATMNLSQITTIGSWGDANLRYFKGDIDEVKFWNRALSQTEIQSKKCTVLNPSNETGLVGYWRFEEGTGSLTNEIINNQNNILTSGVSWINSNNCLSPSISIVSDDNDNSICSGTSITFNSTVTNAGSPPVYQWQINGNNVGSNQPSFTTNNFQNNDVVTCIVNPNSNSVVSNGITIQINELPNISITSSNGTTICNGSTTTLTGNGGISYVWNNGATTQNINATPQNLTTYNLIGTDANGCSNSTSISIQTSTLCAILNPNFCNTTNTNLNTGLVQAQAWVNGATSYQFVFTATNGLSAPVVVNTPNAYIYLQYVNGLQYNTSYNVSIQASNNTVSGPVYTAPCQLNVGQPTVVLNTNFCNTTITNLASGLIQAQAWIRYATYQYTFTPINGGSPVIVNSPNAYVYLNTISGLQYNTSYNVSMQAFVGNISGPINTASCPLVVGAPTVLVNSNFCNNVITNLSSNLVQAQAWVKYATYKYVFTDISTGNQIVYNSPSAYVHLQNVTPSLQYNTTYNVTMQAFVGNIAGPISTATCNLVIGSHTTRIGYFNTEEDNLETTLYKDFNLFPNPANSDIEIRTDLTYSKIELFDATGMNISVDMNGKKIDLTSLKSGVYILKVTTNDGVITRRFVKQN